jgi:hypothetical protein
MEYPLDERAIKDETTVLKKMKVISKSKQRDRRFTLAELDKLMTRFGDVRFARLLGADAADRGFRHFCYPPTGGKSRKSDLDEAHSRIKVRDMKNPEEKEGNDVWCDITPEAMRTIKATPRTDDRIFPYGTDTISAAFTRACKLLAIENLHFHDLRHEGISRLFEMGWTIPHVSAVSGHRSWQSLQRYTHVRQTEDKSRLGLGSMSWRGPHDQHRANHFPDLIPHFC